VEESAFEVAVAGDGVVVVGLGDAEALLLGGDVVEGAELASGVGGAGGPDGGLGALLDGGGDVEAVA
jgi:hypothetical protein